MNLSRLKICPLCSTIQLLVFALKSTLLDRSMVQNPFIDVLEGFGAQLRAFDVHDSG